MTFREIKIALKYDTVKDMLALYGYSESNISRIKKQNPERYELIKIDIVMKHYEIDAENLIGLLQGEFII